MKKTLPIITILISLSLLGLILFQYLWIKSAWDAKDKQVEETIWRTMDAIGQKLTADKVQIVPFTITNDLLNASERMQLQTLKPSVMQRFSKDDINETIRIEFNKNNLKNYPFELDRKSVV